MTLLCGILGLLAVISSLIGLLVTGGPGRQIVTTARGVTVIIYGKGVDAADSWLLETGSRGQDVAMLLMEVPFLLLTLWWYRRGGTVAAVALTGVLALFTYCYVSITFATAENRVFPQYAAAASLAGSRLSWSRAGWIQFESRPPYPTGRVAQLWQSISRSFDPGLVTGHGSCGDHGRYRSQGWSVHEFGDRRT